MKTKTIHCIFIFLLFTISLLFITCEPLVDGGYPVSPTLFSFSIKNETNADIYVKLDVGIIPAADARYTELSAIPDDIYQLGNENWSSEFGTRCTINPKKHYMVQSYLPIEGLGRPYEDDENHTKLREALLDKLISFTLTIYRGDQIIHRIAGWKLPDEDMAANNVRENYYGYYDTAEKNYIYYGDFTAYPVLYSKFNQKPEDFSGDWEEGDNPDAPCYFIKVQESGTTLVEFNPYTYWWVNIDDFWRKH